jgi:hypothetical protein
MFTYQDLLTLMIVELIGLSNRREKEKREADLMENDKGF